MGAIIALAVLALLLLVPLAGYLIQLVAGRYKIGISSDVESAPGVKKRIKDVSPEKSGMEVELAGGSSATLVIDLVKGAVQR